MKKLFAFAFAALLLSFASQATIIGSTSVCLGNSAYVTDSLNPGGVWSSSNTAVATIDAVGQIYGVSVGTTTISYVYGTSPSVTETLAFTVNPAAPPAITGATTVCVASSTTLANSVSGGTWSSNNTSIATVNATTGVVTGVASGYAYIYYYAGGSPCGAILLMHVTTNTPTAITGPSSVCAAGGTITLADSVAGGVWTSSNPAIASINASTGVVTGVTVGTVTITYTYTGACGSVSATKLVNVINTTNPGAISGASTVYVGGTGNLYETVSGGVWSSSNPSIASIHSSTGVVTGLSVGSVTITYTVTGCGGTATALDTVTVVAANSISGDVIFSSSTGGYYGSMKIWLITYNTTTMDLQAVDSIATFASGMSKHYQFLSVPTDSYRVKAAVYDSLGLTTGYIPTYHTSSFYWYSASVINHVSGTDDINKHITMMIGTPTTGPGFIGGNVTTGANKGTATTGIPVVGLSMNVLNSSNQLMQSVRTDASGNYSFSNLPVGTYTVFPDSLNYMTTAYTSIILTTAAPTVNNAGFIQHTISKTITPNPVALNTVNSAASSVIAFPNPASSKLNMQWTVSATENGTVAITDITGREVYKSAINMNAGTGMKQIDLSSFINGLYVISVKSATLNYNSKVQVQH